MKSESINVSDVQAGQSRHKAPLDASGISESSEAEKAFMQDEITPRALWLVVKQHKRSLILANLIAIAATLFSVPLPLLIPLLVDEVLLNQPGQITATINDLVSAEWQIPAVYIGVVL